MITTAEPMCGAPAARSTRTRDVRGQCAVRPPDDRAIATTEPMRGEPAARWTGTRDGRDVRFTLSDERTVIAKAEPLRHALAARTVIETGRAPARGTCWPSIETPERDVRYGLWGSPHRGMHRPVRALESGTGAVAGDRCRLAATVIGAPSGSSRSVEPRAPVALRRTRRNGPFDAGAVSCDSENGIPADVLDLA